MDQKFRNKYRIPSAQLQAWDYGSNGAYFVTICTHKMKYFSGKIMDSKMELSNPDFAWQTRYYTIIIRNDIAFYNISIYIENNPAKWSEDRFH